MAEPQTAIILVTDLVGSTAQRSEIGEDAAEELRRRHDGLLSEAVTDHEGVVVKSLGDGILARFSGAASAVASAATMQQRVDGQFEIRVGISAGDVTLEDDDCFGTPVIEASRLCDQAAGGQILVAELARMLARGRGGHVFEPVGELELKGLPDPVMTSQVVWERIEHDRVRFPSALRRTEGFPFAGRVAALDEITQAWKSVIDGARRIILLSGEPGMGKTRLASELATVAHDGGGTVLFGRSDDEVTSAHRPFTEALGPLIADLPVEVLDAHVNAFGGALAGLVPTLTIRMPGIEAPGGTADEVRLVVYDAVVDLLSRASQLAPVLLLLDDLHWADDGSVLLLKHLARTGDLGAVLVLGTYRDTDLDRGHRLSSVLADLRRVERVERVALDGLDLDEVTSLMASAGGHDLDEQGLELARLVHRETDGNPFFIGEILRHLAESGAIYEADGRWVSDAASIADIGVPQGIREVVGRRLDDLPDDTNAVLRAAAVIGQEFDLTVLAGTLDQSVDDLIDQLDPALDRNLVVEVPAGIDRLRFPHALVRQTLYEELSTSRRVRLHARIAEAYATASGDVTAERAHHLLEAAAVTDIDTLVEAVLAAAASARASVAWETAVEWLERGSEAVADAPDEHPAHAAQLLIARAESLIDGGRYADGSVLAREAAELAQAHGLSKLMANAATALGLVGAWVQHDSSESLALIRAAEEALDPGESAERAELMVARAHLSIHSPDYDEAVRPAREGLAMVRRTGSPRLFDALLTASDNMRGEPDADELLAMAREIAEVADPARRSRSLYFEAQALAKLGRFDQVARISDELLAAADRTRSLHMAWHGHTVQVGLHLNHARWDDAQAVLADIEPMNDVLGQTSLSNYGLQRMLIGYFRRDFDDLAAGFAIMVEATPAWGQLFPYDALIGELDGSIPPAELGRLADEWFATIWPFAPNWMGAGFLGAVGALLRRASPATLAAAAAIVEPHRGLWLVNAGESNSGHSSGTLGLLAAARGDLDVGIAQLTEALDAHDAVGEIPRRAVFAAQTVEVLVERDGPGDLDRAKQLADEVVASCEQHGIALLAERTSAFVA